MQVKIITICLILILVLINFCGCTSPNPEPTDTDRDGYPDSKDDFPNDSNLHVRRIIFDLDKNEDPNVDYLLKTQNDFGWDVKSDDKYVYVLASGSQGSEFSVSGNNILLLDKEDSISTGKRFIVNEQNWGNWKLWITKDNSGERFEKVIIEVWG